MLALSLVATLVTAVVPFAGPPYLTPYLIFCAVGLTGAIAVFLAAPADRLALLAAATAIGLGTSLIGAGIGWLINRQSAYGMMVISVGLGAIGVGAAWLTHGSRPGGTAMFGLGIATWTWSTMNIEVRSELWITSIGLGVGLFLFGGAWQQWQYSEPYLGLTANILGAAMIAFGAVLLPHRQALLIGLGAVGSGAAAIGLGTVLLTHNRPPGTG